MADFGSFVLLIALVFSFYSFAAGVLAIWKGQAADRLAETARRAGIASFWAVVAAAVAAAPCKNVLRLACGKSGI